MTHKHRDEDESAQCRHLVNIVCMWILFYSVCGNERNKFKLHSVTINERALGFRSVRTLFKLLESQLTLLGLPFHSLFCSLAHLHPISISPILIRTLSNASTVSAPTSTSILFVRAHVVCVHQKRTMWNIQCICFDISSIERGSDVLPINFHQFSFFLHLIWSLRCALVLVAPIFFSHV